MQKAQVEFNDFAKLDLKVGRIIEAEEIQESDKLIKLKVDLGQDYVIKTIFAGMKGIVKLNSLVNKNFIFVANLKPRKMMGEESQGMMLAADQEGKPVLIEVSKDVPVGSVVR